MSKPLVKPGAREQYGVQTSIRHRHVGRATIQLSNRPHSPTRPAFAMSNTRGPSLSRRLLTFQVDSLLPAAPGRRAPAPLFANSDSSCLLLQTPNLSGSEHRHHGSQQKVCRGHQRYLAPLRVFSSHTFVESSYFRRASDALPCCFREHPPNDGGPFPSDVAEAIGSG